MEFKKYQHIERLGTTEVEGILNGTVYLFYKIDGTNSCIFLKDNGVLGFGSRNRELELNNDNGGFMNEMINNKKLYNNILNYLNEKNNYIIYGEWLIPHTIKRYKDEAWKKFYVFDVYDTKNNRYLSFDEYKFDLEKYEIDFIPPIGVFHNPSIEKIKESLNLTGNYLISDGLGEGIVIKNYDYKNMYGRTTWAKILTENFVSKKKDTRQDNSHNKNESPVEYQIINNFLTVEFIQKEFIKFKEMKGDFSSKYIFEFLNRIFIEFYKDNWELILKKFSFPIINFKVLRKLFEEEVKKTIF